MTMLQDELRHYIPVSGSPSQFFISIYSFYLNTRVAYKDYRMHASDLYHPLLLAIRTKWKKTRHWKSDI